MIDGENDEISFDWDQAQKELLDEAGIDMAKEMECKLLTMAEEVILFLCFSLSWFCRAYSLFRFFILSKSLRKVTSKVRNYIDQSFFCYTKLK